jgi:1-acyl-sn-glycerol-3-phosphate acyltransferase
MYTIAILIAFFNKLAAWRIIVAWDRLFLKIFGVEIVDEYENPNITNSSGGVYIGLNQESLLEPIIGRVVSRTIFNSIFNIEFALIPLVGWVSWFYGWVIIRQWPGQAKKKLDKAVSYIRNGGFVFISIEGKRSKDGTLNPYKKGPVVLAIKAKSNIIPVIVKGSKYCLPYGEWKIRPGTVTIKFLKEISTVDMNYEDRDIVIEKLHKLAELELQLRQ